MPILDDVLHEEFDRSKRMKQAIEEELKNLPKGYISRKVIKSKPYFYLQKRVGGKVVSIYLPTNTINEINIQIEKRKKLEASLKEVNENLKKLKRVIK